MKAIVVLLALGSVSATAAPTLCQSSESVVFSCEVAGSRKVVSLCSSPDLSSDRGSLAYRFGLPSRIELEFPPRGTHSSAKQFRYAHYFRYKVDGTEITFNVGEYSYTVFAYYEDEERPSTSEGVHVSRAQKVRTLKCLEKAKVDFAPIEAAVPCDTESKLAKCP
jgi:hypothetical protein